MTALQKIVLGTPPAAVDGDPVRTASTKMNANVDVLNTQATLTSFAPTLTVAQALTAANHLGKRVNINLASAGTINLPAASTCVADGQILLRNLGTTLITLAITAGSGDTIALTALAAGESALMDTDGAHAWNCLVRGRSSSLNESVLGTLSIGGAITSPLALSYAPTAANTGGLISVAPSGTSTIGQFLAYGKSDVANASTVSLYVSGSNTILNTGKTGTGAANPLDIYTNTSFNTRFYVGGGFGVGGGFASALYNGAVHVSAGPFPLILNNPSAFATPSAGYWAVGPNGNNNFVVFSQGSTGCYVAVGATAWAGQSDERLKNIRSEITGAVDAIKEIRTVRYTWKADDDHAEALGVVNDSRVHVGVIAQDVQKHVPEAVSVSHDEYLGVAYTDLVPLCMAAIKELSEKLDSAQAQINALQARAA